MRRAGRARGDAGATGRYLIVAAQAPLRVGLIVPPLHGSVPPDASAMYPDVVFDVEGLGVRALDEAGYEEAVGRVGTAAATLAARGAGSVLLFGTSLSFFRGPSFNDELEHVMRTASGLPAGTLTTGLSQALRCIGAPSIAAATAYTRDVDLMFADYFGACGFKVDHVDGLGITSLAEVEGVAPSRIAQLARNVARSAPQAGAIVLSCAGLRTWEICPQIEAELGKPVLSSAMVGSWAAVRLAGHSGVAPGMGKLYERE